MAKKEIQTIYDLPGVGAATAEKLIEQGYDDLMSVAVASPGELVELGLSESSARKIIVAARNALKMDFITGEELLKRREKVLKITTGSKALDALLGGGIETGSITEAFGPYGASKTQLAHQLAVNIHLNEACGKEPYAIFIDTENTFRPERIKQMAEGAGLEPSYVLSHIKMARAFNSDHQMLLAEKIDELIKKENLNVKLVVVDSLTAHFRAEFIGRGTLAERQQKLNKHMHVLMKLADKHNLAVYVTNQVMAKPDVFFGDPTEAIGGNVVAHNCLAADSLIQLADGTIKPIGDLFNENLAVPGIDFENDLKLVGKKINQIFVNCRISKIREIDAGMKIKCSLLHRFFRLSEEGEIQEVFAKDLKEGDYIACVKRIKVEGKEQRLPQVKVERVAKLDKASASEIKQRLIEAGMSREELCEKLPVTPRQLRRILNQGWPTHEEVFEQLSSALGLKQICIQRCITNKHKGIVIPEMLNEDIAQILGYLIGDGNIGKRSLRFRDERLDVLEEYARLFKKNFNVEGRIRRVKGKQCFNLSINSKALAELFSKLRDRVFEYISKSPTRHICRFIKGFFDAEGYIEKRRPLISVSQKNELLLKYIQMLLLRLGIFSSLEKTNKGLSYLRIERSDSVVRFAEMIGVSAVDKKELLEKAVQHCMQIRYNKEVIPISRRYLWNLLKKEGLSPSRFMRSRPDWYKFMNISNLKKLIDAAYDKVSEETRKKFDFIKKLIDGDIGWVKIRRIKEHENVEPLFDLSVPGIENYIANGFVVHNSAFRIYLRRGKKGTRVAKLVDSPNLPEGECVFMVTSKGIRDVK